MQQNIVLKSKVKNNSDIFFIKGAEYKMEFSGFGPIYKAILLENVQDGVA